MWVSLEKARSRKTSGRDGQLRRNELWYMTKFQGPSSRVGKRVELSPEVTTDSEFLWWASLLT
jgi:hypothetical protein